jgi:squalene synthase HpnC
VSGSSLALARAYAACEAMARAHYENFPVASRLLPRAMRPHIGAVYAFARTADDLADEGLVPDADRQIRLDALGRRLHAAVAIERSGSPASGSDEADGFMLRALAHSIVSLDLPLSLFDDLLSAFGQDTMTKRYDSWAAVFDYCRRSANPVGRLVLRIAGYDDPALDQSSDALCTALQLTNFWQDFGRDWQAGRLYVPRETWESSGASEQELAGAQLTPSWTRAMGGCIEVTRRYFNEGRAVCDGVRGRLGLELRVTWLGGSRVLDQVERLGPEILNVRPALTAADAPVLIWRAITWHHGS